MLYFVLLDICCSVIRYARYARVHPPETHNASRRNGRTPHRALVLVTISISVSITITISSTISSIIITIIISISTTAVPRTELRLKDAWCIS